MDTLKWIAFFVSLFFLAGVGSVLISKEKKPPKIHLIILVVLCVLGIWWSDVRIGV